MWPLREFSEVGNPKFVRERANRLVHVQDVVGDRGWRDGHAKPSPDSIKQWIKIEGDSVSLWIRAARG